jgi:hypothetical protein
LEAALERHFERTTARARQLDADAPYSERLAAYLRHIVAAMRPAAPVLMGDILATTPWAWDRITRYRRDEVLARLRTLLEEGRGRGFLRDDLDVAAVPALYTAIVDQVAQPAFLLGWEVGFDRLIDAVIQILLGGILSAEGRRQLAEAGLGGTSMRTDGVTAPALDAASASTRAEVGISVSARRHRPA